MSKHTVEASTAELALRSFLDERERQKLRGLNDYNLIGSLLKWHDEVRVHSGFLYSMLNPNGLHYQGDLFLRKFIDLLGIRNFDFNKAEVQKEKKRVDLYITDGTIKIIIELKVFAVDQHHQAARYIALHDKNPDNQQETLHFVYLSPGRKKLSATSLGDTLTVCDNYIVEGTRKVCQFHNIHYSPDIENWVNDCQKEVRNIKNLDFAYSDYRDILSKVSRTHQSNLTGINAFFNDMGANNTPSDKAQRIDFVRHLIKHKENYEDIKSGEAHFETKEVKEVINLALSHVARSLEQSINTFDELLGEKGNFQKLTANTTDANLGGYLYKQGNAKAFFQSRKGSKNKGSFWVADTPCDDSAERWAIVLLFGSALLHLGMIKVQKKAQQAGTARWSLVKPGKDEASPVLPDGAPHLEFSEPFKSRLCLFSTNIGIHHKTSGVPEAHAFQLDNLFDDKNRPIQDARGLLGELMRWVTP